MPAPFTTFFGDYLHGLWITWESVDISGSAGINVTFQANYRARQYTYGTSTADTADNLTYDFDYTGTSGGAPATMTDDQKRYIFYVAWTNPDTTNEVAKDGIAAVTECSLTAGPSATADQPTLDC